MFGWRRLDHPFVYAVAAIVLIEATIARLASTQVPASRNPFDAHAWERYLRETIPSRAGELRVLLLSNSQAVAANLPGGDIYPALLEERLNRDQRWPRIRIVNWSLSGVHVPEAIVLLARARELRPALVVGILPPMWFTEVDYQMGGRPTPLTAFEGDVVETAWLHRDALPAEFRAHYLTPALVLPAQLAVLWPSYQLRDVPLALLDGRWSWLTPFLPERGQPRPRIVPQVEKGKWSDEPHPALVRMFSAAASALGVPRVFAVEPLAWPVTVPAVLSERLADKGWQVMDLTRAIPAAGFEPDRVHLLPAGHRTMAEVLATALAPRLDEIAARP